MREEKHNSIRKKYKTERLQQSIIGQLS